MPLLILTLLLALPTLAFPPLQIHLSYSSQPHSLHVQWLTFGPTASTSLLLCSSLECSVVSGYSKKWLYRDKKKFESGVTRYLHHADLWDLRPGARYIYRVGSNADNEWSRNLTFLGPFQDGPGRIRTKDDCSLLVLGDFGTCSGLSRETLLALEVEAEEMRDDAFVHTGDIAYNLEYQNGHRGDDFQQTIEPFASRIPYQVVVGNHEKHQNFTHFKHRFTMPGDTQNMYYSFNVGPVHAVVYSSEVFCEDQRCRDVRVSQLNWLISDLQQAQQDRAVRPWVVAFAHKPLYCSTDWRDTDSIEDCFLQPLAMRREYEDLLAAFKVDVHFHGHVHAYERTEPIYQGGRLGARYMSNNLVVDQKAPIYVVEGSAGTCRENDVAYPSLTPEPWSIFRSPDLGYTRLNANLTSLKLTRIRSSDRLPEDSLLIIKTQTIEIAN